MGAAVVAVAVLMLSLWVALPLLRPRDSERAYEDVNESMEKILESKHSVYRSILDLELEHRLGKLGDDEYRKMRAHSEAEALELIAQSEPVERARPLDEILEEEIREARRRLRSKT